MVVSAEEGRLEVTVGDESRTRGRVLMLVQNLSLPLDRRVWQEACALREAGFEVMAICPQGPAGRDQEPFERLEGIEIHRYPPRTSSGGAVGYVREYASAFRSIRRLVRHVARSGRFDVVHAASPPDFLLLAARPLRRRGARFVFDHHDLSPELYASRYGRERGLLYRILVFLERVAFRSADVVIATNESYRKIAIESGHVKPENVLVVRNGPDLAFFSPSEPEPALRRGKRHLLCYVGMMGPQDGVDHALEALAVLRERRDDWHALFLGDGDALPAMRRLAGELGLDDAVTFAGFVGRDDVRRAIATADVCLSPEPSNPLNDVSTMIKVAEYMAMGRPLVAYDLPETRFTAGDAAVYARPSEPEDLAAAIESLLCDPLRRKAMGAAGRERVEQMLSWDVSTQSLHAAYERVLAGMEPARLAPEPTAVAADA